MEKQSSEGEHSAVRNLHPAAVFGKIHISSQLILWWYSKATRSIVEIQVDTTVQLDGCLILQYEGCIPTVDARNISNYSTV